MAEQRYQALLAVIGVYGVVSYSVARRQLEIGVRMALGGQPRDLIGLLVFGFAAGVAGGLVGVGGGVIFVPALGMVSAIITTFTQRPVFAEVQ